MRRWIPALTASLALSAAPWLAARTASAAPPTKTNDVSQGKNAYMIGYAHLDTQWRWTYIDTIRDYLPDTMRMNFAHFEKYPDYVFNFTGANRYRMMKEYYPSDYQKVKQYIAAGRWYPNGSSWEESDVNVPSSESIVRQVLYGNQYFKREFGIVPKDYILPDCFGFPASLPSILAHCGVKGFSTQKLTWGSAVGIPFPVGVWKGPDGKGVIAALDAGSYVGTINEDLSQSQFLLNRINRTGDQSGAYVDYRYFGSGDKGGAVGESSVQWLERSLAGTGPVRVISARADQMFRDITPQQEAKLPVYQGDLELTEHSAGSLTSQAYMKRWNRKNELLADAAERASVAADWLGATPYPRAKLNEAWALILGAQFHDILPGTSLPEAYDFSWNDEVVALNHSAAALQGAVGGLTRGLDTRATGVPLVVYNPLSIAREDVVQATVRFPGAAPKSVRVFGASGEVPSQVVKRSGSSVEVLFLARVPSVGFASFDVRPASAPYAGATGLKVTKSALENARYRVTLNADGDVAQVFDKVAKRNLLSGPARLAFKFEEPSVYPAWNIDWKDQKEPPTGYVSGPATVRVVENGPVRVALEVTRNSQGSRFVQRIRLAARGAGNRVEFDNDIDWYTTKHTLKASFPLAVSNEMATYNLGMGTIQRGTNDPKKYEVVSHEWFDLTGTKGDYGVSVLEDSKFGSDKPDDHTLRLTLIRTPSSLGYEDENTQDVGHHQVLYALTGHSGDWRKGQSPWEAARLNQPLAAFQAPSHGGNLGKVFSLLQVNTGQVKVVAIKKAEESNEIIVRLQELTGAPARNVRIVTASRIVSAREVDGQERPLGPARLERGMLVTDLSANTARAFAIRLGTPPARLSAPASRPLPLQFDMRAATTDGEADKTGFDGKGHTFAADLMPASLTSEGISFRLAPGGKGRASAVSAKGQTVALPGGGYRQVYILAAATGGDQRGTFRVGGRPVSLTVQDWGQYIGQWDKRLWTQAEAGGAPRRDGGIYGLRPAYIKRDTIAWVGRHRHTATGANDIYAYSYLFKYRIPVPANAKALTLPNNPKIRVFAITAATGTNDDTQPARYLYDAFTNPVSGPAILPSGGSRTAAGSYRDSVQVAVQPPLYNPDVTLRYTTDGRMPTAKSPVYTGTLSLARSARLTVRAFRKDGTAGAVASKDFRVADVTAPSVRSVVALAGSPIVRVAFSEPVDKAAGAKAQTYGVSGLTVKSAALSDDGRSVDLTVDPAPAAEGSYSLALRGLRDRSPAGNVARADGGAFRPAVPVMELTSDAAGQVVLDSAAGLTARTVGSPSTAAGPAGNALSFNGTTDAVVIANAPALNPKTITVAAWVRATDWRGNRRILQKGNDDSQYRLLSEEGRLVFEVAGAGRVVTALPSTGAWHHIAATADATTLRLYVDGVPVARADSAGTLATTDDPLNIGTKTERSGAVDHFHGEIGDIRLYDRALLPAHVRALARADAG